jgi:8-oxo-dGTP pyrophosphatase MutT (NUDIX family)
VNVLPPELLGIKRALRPLDLVPQGPCWNIDDLSGLLSATDPVAAAVLVGLVPRSSGLQVLLTRRNDAMRHHAGQVSFPGGRIEPDDLDASAAAVRETTEETGIPASLIQPLGYLDPLATVTGFRVQPVVAVIQPEYVADPDAREVDEVFEVPFVFLMHPGNLHSFQLDLGGRPRSVLQFVDRGEASRRIWGASASILFNLRQRLETIR